MNNQKDTFSCKFNFEIDGIDYFIERQAHTTKTEKVKVNVNFWRVIDGVDESLNGDERRNTNDVIKKYLGTYEDFVMTSLSLQGNNALFIDKSQSERKDILAQYIGVNVFDKLFDVVSEDNKEAAILLKNFKKDDFSLRLAELEDGIKSNEGTFKELVGKQGELETEKTDAEKELNGLESQIVTSTTTIDLHKTQDELNAENLSLNGIKERLEKMEGQLGSAEQIVTDLRTQKESLDTFKIGNDDVDVENAYSDWVTANKDLSKEDREYQLLKQKIESVRDKLSHLEKHEYDPNCKFCCDNVFVKDAMKAKEELEGLEVSLADKLSDVNSVMSVLSVLEGVEDAYSEYKEKDKQINDAVTLVSRIKAEIAGSGLKIHQTEDKIKDLEAKIDEYYKNREQIELNKELYGKVKVVKAQIEEIKKEHKKVSNGVLDANTTVSKLKQEKETINGRIAEVKKLEETNKLYDYYLDAVKRDGISYELISRTLPAIEGEINNILGQIVDFSMNLQMDGKNVNAYINYGDNRKWPLEMCSGMEKFVSGLAIRVALINICNLPRPNFLVIDEGFGTLDSENLQSLFMAFAYLKTQFEFVIVISHIDSMRDVVDSLLEIKKDNGFSSVKF
jgi:DNA repair exonuclease SbcCD ATPase subunit